jgi:hypothetical protein
VVVRDTLRSQRLARANSKTQIGRWKRPTKGKFNKSRPEESTVPALKHKNMVTVWTKSDASAAAVEETLKALTMQPPGFESAVAVHVHIVLPRCCVLASAHIQCIRRRQFAIHDRVQILST